MIIGGFQGEVPGPDYERVHLCMTFKMFVDGVTLASVSAEVVWESLSDKERASFIADLVEKVRAESLVDVDRRRDDVLEWKDQIQLDLGSEE